MHPAYFGLVMATGIVSIAALLTGWRVVAIGLLALNLLCYPLLWALTLVRILRHRQRVVTDLLSHSRAIGFFTAVPATCVLGSQLLIVGDAFGPALALWILGILLWALLTYGIFTVLTVKIEKPLLADGINGGWLISVVAAQSVCVLGAQLAPRLGTSAPPALLFCLAMWLGGGMLYLWIIGLIFYRYTFFPMSPADLAPPYWVNMGAAAISTLAGAVLVAATPHSPALQQVLPFVRGLTLLWWATASWCIPMLIVLGIWRHVYRRFPLRYDPLYWGAVFPLGMYPVCTAGLAQAIDAAWLAAVPLVFVYLALATWLATFAGLLRELVHWFRERPIKV
jgi:tellurite resistance protein TehA-like permease